MKGKSPDMTFPPRDLSLDAVRGILVVFVLVLHAEMISGIGRLSVVGYLNMSVGPILMPLFFLMSGLLMEKSLRRSWTHFFRAQVLRLAWPFAIWGVIYACFVSLVEEKLPFGAEIFITLVLRPTDLGPVWYLHFLLVFFVLARATRSVPAVALLVLFVVGALITALITGRSPTILIHAASFFLGILMARHPAAARLFGVHRSGHRAFLFATALFLTTTPFVAGDSLRDNAWGLPIVLFACVTILSCRDVIHHAIGSKWVIWIGVNSLPVYLVHWPVMLIVWRVNSGVFSFEPPELFWLALVLSLLVGVALAGSASRYPFVAVLFSPPKTFSDGRLLSSASTRRLPR